MKLLLLFYCLLICLYGSAQAKARGGELISPTSASDSSRGTTYAIIAGVSKYNHLNPLDFADKDALLFKNFLMSKAGGNVPEENIRYGINDSVTTGFLNGSIPWLNGKKISKGDKIYCFLAGHGDAHYHSCYFFCADADTASGPGNAEVQGNLDIPYFKNRFAYYAKDMGVNVFFIVDACRTNTASNGGDIQRAADFSKQASVPDVYVPSLYTFYSTRDGYPAYESPSVGSGHGIFSYYLVEGLMGMADQEVSGNNDGQVSLFELGSWLKTQVPKVSKQINRQEQMPDYWSSNDDKNIVCRIDTVAFNHYKSISKTLDNLLADSLLSDYNLVIAKKRSVSSSADAQMQKIYGGFLSACKNGNLTGMPGSAEDCYNKMLLHSSGHELTQDARIMLLTSFLNYAQRKINLYLAGTDVSYIKKEMNSYEGEGDRYIELQRISTTSFGDAATYMQKAIGLVNDNDLVTKKLEPKYCFLKARSFFDGDNTMKVEDAIALTKHALSVDTGAVYLYFLMGMLEQAKNSQSNLAEQYFLKAVQGESKWSKANLEIGYYYYKLKKFKQAERFYKQSIQTDQSLSRAYNNLAILMENQHNYEEAEALYQKSLEKTPGDSVIRMNLANYYNERGLDFKKQNNYKKSKEYLLNALQTDSGFISPYINLGNVFYLEKDYSQALSYYRRALKFDTLTETVSLYMGMCYFSGGDYSQANTIFSKLSQVVPPGSYFYNESKRYMAFASRYLSQPVSAGSQPGTRKPFVDTTLPLLATAKRLLQSNKTAEAESYFLAAIGKDSAEADAYLSLGKMYLNQSKYSQAEQYLKTGVDYTSYKVDLYILLGKVYELQKKYTDAEGLYLSYYKYNPKNTDILSRMVNLYNRLGKDSEAKKYDKELGKLYK